MALARTRTPNDDLTDDLYRAAITGEPNPDWHSTDTAATRNPGTTTTPTTPTQTPAPPTNTSPSTQTPAAPTPGIGTGNTQQGSTFQVGITGTPGVDRNQLGAAYNTYLGREMGEGDYAAHQGNMAGTQGAVSAVRTSKEAQGYTAVQRYTEQYNALKAETDPTRRAQMADGLARQVATDLTNQGHQVAWEGNVLVVDGRRYTLATGDPNAGGAGSVPSNGTLTGGAGSQPATSYGAVQGSGPGGGTRWEGYNSARASASGDPNSAKDALFRVGSSLGIELQPNQPREYYGQAIQQIVDAGKKAGLQIEVGNGFDTVMLYTAERGWEEVDIIGDAGGGDPRFTYLPKAEQGMGTGGTGTGGVGTGTGVSTTTSGTGTTAQATDYFAGAPVAPASPIANPLTLTAPGYTPGVIGMEDIPDLTYEDMLAQMGSVDPNALPGMENSSADDQLAAYIQNLLANPESLNADTVDKMKGVERDTLAQQQKLLDEQLTASGAEMGLSTSPWLESERVQAQRDTGLAALKGSRDIDISAAKTNTEDRRKAGELGARYTEGVARAQEGRRKTVFDAEKLKSDNVAAAAKAAIDRSMVIGDRLTLQESVKQAATELGLQADQIMTDYIKAQAADLTQRYGIDVAKYVDLTTLTQQSKEHKENLMLHFAELAETMRAHDMDYGLGMTGLGINAENNAWNQYLKSQEQGT